MKKILGYFGIVLISSVLLFYFWGSSSNLNKEEYATIFTNEGGQPILEKDTFTICTYNIGYLSGMTNNLAVERDVKLYEDNLIKAKSLISGLDTDFVAFQEIDFNSSRSFFVDQMSELAKQGAYNYSARAINWDKKYVPFPYWPPAMHFGAMLSGQGLISKYPIKENSFHILQKPESNAFYYNAFYIERLAQVSKVEIEGKQLVIINVHLEAWDIPTRELQAATVLQLFEDYANDYPVLLVGDFNSTPPFATEPGEYIDDKTTQLFFNNKNIGAAINKEHYLSNESSFFTFDSKEPNIKIDFIFYNKNKISPISGRVINEAGEISDHLPVWFKFSVID